MRPVPDPVGPGQTSVWSFPRPAIAEPSRALVVIRHAGLTIAETRRAWRVVETSHPPSWYLPPDAVAPGLLMPSERRSWCEWKGMARYWHLALPTGVMRDVGWSYPDPTPAFSGIADHIAFYCAPFDACLVDGMRATPQPGGFYGGWVTPDLAGPFKGGPGTMAW